jgi:hypothetical protein
MKLLQDKEVEAGAQPLAAAGLALAAPVEMRDYMAGVVMAAA